MYESKKRERLGKLKWRHDIQQVDTKQNSSKKICDLHWLPKKFFLSILTVKYDMNRETKNIWGNSSGAATFSRVDTQDNNTDKEKMIEAKYFINIFTEWDIIE
jgi:hypothetical protein